MLTSKQLNNCFTFDIDPKELTLETKSHMQIKQLHANVCHQNVLACVISHLFHIYIYEFICFTSAKLILHNLEDL